MSKGKVDEAVAAAWARVQIAQSRIGALQFATRGLEDSYRYPVFKDDLSALWSALYAELNQAYSHVFMWGALIDGPTRVRAAELALSEYLSQDKEIMSHLNPEGRAPSSWAVAQEKSFRKELKELEKEFRKNHVKSGRQ